MYNILLMQKPQISFSDFDKIDIRVGKVIDAVEVENSSKLIKLTVDLGEEYKIKTIFAGVKPAGYTPDDLIGKQFAFIANLAPRKMMGSESQGMMLAADKDGKPVIIEINQGVAPGSIIM